MKSEATTQAKTLDKGLAKVQTFVLDALAPLTALLETGYEELSPTQLQGAASSAVQLIGNANAHISRLCQEKIIAGVNKSLIPLVKDDSPYVDAAPDLFGPDFAKRSKEFLDQVKMIRSSLPTKGHNPENKGRPLFRKGQSSGRTGAFKRGGASISYTGVTETDKPEKGTSRININDFCENKSFKYYPPVNNKMHGYQPSEVTIKSSRAAGTLCLQLEQINQGPMGLGHNKGIQNGVPLHALPSVQTTHLQVQQRITNMPY